MTDHVVRLYALAGSVLALFLAWAGIAAQPWRQDTPAATPRGSTPTSRGCAEMPRSSRESPPAGAPGRRRPRSVW